MALKNIANTHFESVPVNVYNIKTKEIVFTGNQKDAALFIGTSSSNLSHSLRLKSKIKKQFAVRFKILT